jgi:uncharacterized cupredoxin-like copper-binding protein
MRMYKFWLASLATLLFGLAACSNGNGGATAPSAIVPKDAQTLAITGKDIVFAETAVSATAGKPIAVNFKNAGALEHSIIFDLPPTGDKAGDLGLPADWANSLRGVGAGKSETLVLPALQPGAYQYYCHVPGHEAMVGTLTVR